MVNDILSGARYLLQGFRLVVRPGVKRFFLIPLFINIGMFTVLIWLGIGLFGSLMDWLLPAGEGWWIVFARVALWLLFAVSALLIMFFSFTLAANLISAPFNGLLSEKVEKLLTGEDRRHGPAGLGDFISGIPPTLLNELRKIVYFLVFSAPVLILAVIPAANVAFPFVWIVFTSWMLSLEYSSYPLENQGLRFKQVRNRLAEKRMRTLGFGLAVAAATLVPFVNLVVIPAAVAGATAMWADTDRPATKDTASRPLSG